MNLQRAALLAAIGVLMRGLYYWIANLIPSWNSSGSTEQVALLMVAVVDPLIWAIYFVTVWRGMTNMTNRIAAVVAGLLGLAEVGFTGYRQYEFFSTMSLDTLAFFFGGVVPVLCWALFLFGIRGRLVWLWYLLFYCLFQVALYVYQISATASLIPQFWSEEPWQLLAVPAIWLFYWLTQALFVRSAQKA